MDLNYVCVDDIPALAYCVRVRGGTAHVYHGPQVETADSFFTDGVWAGDFAEGAMDRRFMFGTGGMASQGLLRLASSNTPMDRVFTTRIGSEFVASNSLPFFLAVTDDSLDGDRLHYRSFFVGQTAGLRVAPRTLVTMKGRRVRVLLGEVATVNADGEMVSRLRPLDREFHDFGDYRDEISATVRAIVANGRSSARQIPLEPLVSLSAGYDSLAVAVLAREAGVREAATMLRYDATGDLVDHPGEIAAQLGLLLHEFDRDTWRNRTDLPDAEIAAAATNFIDIPSIAMEDCLPGRMLFVGHSGDNVWSRHNFRRGRDIVRGDTSGQGLSEYRLRVGFVLCPIPYIGHTSQHSLFRISNSSEMSPWSVGETYDRPIARRIIEEEGIPRSGFALRKYAGGALVGRSDREYSLGSDAAMENDMREFMTQVGAASFVAFCHEADVRRNTRRMSFWSKAHWLYGKVLAVNYRVGRRLHRFGVTGMVPRRLVAALASRASVHTDYTYLLPHWGTNMLKERYMPTAADQPPEAPTG